MDKLISFTGGLFVLSLLLVATLCIMAGTGTTIPPEFMAVVSSVVSFWTGTQIKNVATRAEVSAPDIKDLIDKL